MERVGRGGRGDTLAPQVAPVFLPRAPPAAAPPPGSAGRARRGAPAPAVRGCGALRPARVVAGAPVSRGPRPSSYPRGPARWPPGSPGRRGVESSRYSRSASSRSPAFWAARARKNCTAGPAGEDARYARTSGWPGFPLASESGAEAIAPMMATPFAAFQETPIIAAVPATKPHLFPPIPPREGVEALPPRGALFVAQRQAPERFAHRAGDQREGQRRRELHQQPCVAALRGGRREGAGPQAPRRQRAPPLRPGLVPSPGRGLLQRREEPGGALRVRGHVQQPLPVGLQQRVIPVDIEGLLLPAGRLAGAPQQQQRHQRAGGHLRLVASLQQPLHAATEGPLAGLWRQGPQRRRQHQQIQVVARVVGQRVLDGLPCLLGLAGGPEQLRALQIDPGVRRVLLP
jgi:hypothetical protein